MSQAHHKLHVDLKEKVFFFLIKKKGLFNQFMEKKKEVVQGCGDSSHMFLSLLPWAGGKPEALTAHVFLALGMCLV